MLDGGAPPEVIKRAVTFQQRWGGLVLPPAPEYEGGPLILEAGFPEPGPSGEWYFGAGSVRATVPYEFVVGPQNEFGIGTHVWTVLHATVDGWVESVALAYHAAWTARRVTRVRGAEVDDIDLDGFEPVRAAWWCGPDGVIAIHRGEAELLGDPALKVTRVYEGVTLDGWED
ncbi:hypothetical protein C8D87_11693 [Lentzea atacamensis]|uniref:Uncharacterized protein n=2 Tax=Lentzea TaxID=165301 RepID=A0ABX9DYF4_9PSEU|nr:hypothetical protein [Lentzea atacamensis]RAS59038.1 hypothetical protein C8D87_11693 [Lentzea atacamensis]